VIRNERQLLRAMGLLALAFIGALALAHWLGWIK
jgi:hypothetical protein